MRANPAEAATPVNQAVASSQSGSGVGLAGLICPSGAREVLASLVAGDDTPGPVSPAIAAQDGGGLASFHRGAGLEGCLAERGGVIAAVVGHPHDRHDGRVITPERVLDAYAEGSVAALAKSCLGDFSLAIVDPVRQEAVLVSDRVALRPVFYTTAAGDFRFSSTVWALAAGGRPSLTVNYTAVACWLFFGYAMECQTLFAEVAKVEPGSILRYRDGRVRIEF